MGSQSHHRYPYKRDAEGDGIEMHREEGNVKAEVGIGEMWPQVKEHLESPKAGRERQATDSAPKPLMGMHFC